MGKLVALVACISLYFCLALGQHEERLISNLFQLDNLSFSETLKIARPPGNSNGTVKVDISYSDIEIKHVDEGNGHITISLMERKAWQDSRLMWDPSQYGGVTMLRIPPSYIWLPDVTLYTVSGEIHTKSSSEVEKLIISNDGTVMWIPKLRFTFACEFDITLFPFDSQTCVISLGSWVHHMGELELGIVGKVEDNLVGARNHSNWIFRNRTVISEVTKYPCCAELYQTLKLKLVMERRPKFYVHLLIAPWEVVSFALPLLHLLPPGCSQKSVIAGLLFVCSILLHMELCTQIRGFAGERTPFIVDHYREQMILIVVSIAISSLTAALANTAHTSTRVPPIIRKVINSVVAKIFCLNLGGTNGNFKPLSQTSGDEVRYSPQTDTAPIVQDISGVEAPHEQPQETAQQLQHLVDELQLNRERRQLEMEWNQLALLIDRVGFLIFLAYAFASTKVVPHGYL